MRRYLLLSNKIDMMIDCIPWYVTINRISHISIGEWQSSIEPFAIKGK